MQRFWDKVDRSAGPASCWPWKAGTNSSGYGSFQFATNWPEGAHRVAFFLTNGWWPEQVMHSCDNKICCNPSHLSAGNQVLNEIDKVKKGRSAKGSRNGCAKLTERQVLEIKERLYRGEKQRDIALDYDVGYKQISYISLGKSWGWL